MNEQKSGARFNRKVVWVGGGIAALAVILVASSSFDFPPGGQYVGRDRACAAFPRRAAGDDERKRPGPEPIRAGYGGQYR